MTAPTNGEIADLLQRHGQLLEIAGESPFRSRAFSRAADAVRDYPRRLADVSREGSLRQIPGVGEGIAAAIEQVLDTGTFDAHEELTANFPDSLGELLAIPGVGAKTAQRLHQHLGVDDLATLEAALVSGRIATTKSLGAKVETTIRAGLEALQRRTGRLPLGAALPTARALLAAYTAVRPGDSISLAGSARRWDVTVGDLDFVIGTSDPNNAMTAMANLPMVAASEPREDGSLSLALANGLRSDVFITAPKTWGSVLVRATGNAAHLDRLGSIADAATEEEVYASRGLPWIPPELRSGDEEFTRWAEIPKLIALGDINGEFHCHSTWSDGGASIRQMAEAAAARGYTFLGISDHSHGLGVAGGLNVERLMAQGTEIAAESGVAGVQLLRGAEVEVHRDGSLDYDDETLASLDVVVASLHSGLRQPRAEITDRLLSVLANPNVDIIAHPSGRLIERREGGDFDWDQAFAAAAQSGTVLEINADPARLDLDPHLARRAHDAGCLITVNCDAHSPGGFSVMEYGVSMARKAWLEPTDVLNCWPKERVLAWLRSRG